MPSRGGGDFTNSRGLQLSQTRIHRREQDYRTSDGEHPSVVLDDVLRRPKVDAEVIVFANEKGGVGKSTLAFHTCIGLARSGHRVLAVDLDRRQRSLARALEHREATKRSLDVNLPSPISLVLEQQSCACLLQEIARVGSGCDKIVIDVAGHDSPIARRAIALADKLITPVNATFVDLDSLAHFNPATMKYSGMGQFARMVTALREGKAERGLRPALWTLVKNRVRKSEKKQLKQFDKAFTQLVKELDVRLAPGLAEQVAYRELSMFGLTHADCPDLPTMGHRRVRSGANINALLSQLEIATDKTAELHLIKPKQPKLARSMKRYRQSLRTQLGADESENEAHLADLVP